MKVSATGEGGGPHREQRVKERNGQQGRGWGNAAGSKEGGGRRFRQQGLGWRMLRAAGEEGYDGTPRPTAEGGGDGSCGPQEREWEWMEETADSKGGRGVEDAVDSS